jgi:sulfhydrogenase subunit gamma (sulfur reductase)
MVRGMSVGAAVDRMHLPCEAEVVGRTQEVAGVFTLHLRIVNGNVRNHYRFAPGQFNMLYLYGVGEAPISIVSDPEDHHILHHTIRAVGRVTDGLANLKQGDRLGLRGPFGRGWPLETAEGKDVVIITGGLGCAPTVSVINYVMRRRERYGRLIIIQGVKHAQDLFWRTQYEAWAKQHDTQVLLAADEGSPLWPWHVGPVTVLFGHAHINPARSIVMMCGPEGMMRAAVKELTQLGLTETAIWLSMERNMHCAIGQCGHCQFGPRFICRDGPVFPYMEVKELFGVKGF